MKRAKNSVRARLKRIQTAALFVWLMLLLLPSIAHAQQSPPPKRVLVLYWYNKDHIWNIGFDKSFQAALQSARSGPVEYYPEYLETNRFPGENQALLLRDYLKQKYAALGIDVVVASSDASLDFLLKHRDDLFPNTPIVFISAKPPTTEKLMARPGMTGIVNLNAYRKNLDLALRLHPRTEEVFVISGTLERDRRFETLAREELAGYESRIPITYLTDLPPDELIAKVKRLPERSLVLYIWQQSVNEQGTVLESADVLVLIARSAMVPIYGMSFLTVWSLQSEDLIDGRGIVGGYITTSEVIGTRAAEISLRISNGELAQDIPVEGAPAVPMFDWRELRRWGISEDQLPPGSIVRFRVPSIWDEYKWRIFGLISLVIVQSALIAGLLINRVRRKRAEESLQKTQSELAHVGRVMLTGELAATIAHEVNQPLTAMVANANATRRMLGNGNADLDEAREAIDDIVKDAHRASQVVGRIRSLLRKDPHRTEPLAINEVIEEVVAIARNDLVGKRVSLRMELGEGLPKVKADRVEIQQVMLNLMMNAVEAMRSVEEGSRNLVMRTTKDESGSVLVEVQDSGVGIASENLAHIFDAFYTTRQEGMGMGLSICRTIIEAHGGKLWAKSNNDRGATFRFTLQSLSGKDHE
jgi:signal transduction histidine kinase